MRIRYPIHLANVHSYQDLMAIICPTGRHYANLPPNSQEALAWVRNVLAILRYTPIGDTGRYHVVLSSNRNIAVFCSSALHEVQEVPKRSRRRSNRIPSPDSSSDDESSSRPLNKRPRTRRYITPEEDQLDESSNTDSGERVLTSSRATSSSEPEHTGVDLPPSTTSMSSSTAAVEEDIDELSTGSGSPPPRSPSPRVKRSGSPPRSSSPCGQQRVQVRSSVPLFVGKATAAHVGESSNEVVTGGSEVVPGGSKVIPGDVPVVPEVPQAVPGACPSLTETAVPISTPEQERRSAIPVPPPVSASYLAELLARGEPTSNQTADERVSTTRGAGSSTRLLTGQGDNAAESHPSSSTSTLQPTLSLRSALHTYTKLRIEDLAPGMIDSDDLDRQMIKLSGMLDGCDGLDRRRRQELESHMHEWLVATFRRCNQAQAQR
ncbi:hypothetical protein FFLO_06740 [Filobasidium floriforme]|uniref:Uncharacterized protein n=1 Tax=Filobasidium floriforme TaxID=5210 RepID=A0A8K0NLU5_9TREE|nr:hypothetical protein FFLO_06740 [Filobasidium floriforme]